METSMLTPKDFGFTNKYLKAYLSLCAKRLLDPYFSKPLENHHIYPVSIFKKNTQTVSLSLREHFIAHRLLQKAYQIALGATHPHTVKMTLALQYLAGKSSLVRGSHNFATFRELYRVAHTQHNKDLWQDPKFRSKMVEIRNQQFNEASSLKMAESRNHFIKNNPEVRITVSQHFKQFYQNEEHRQAARDRLTQYRNDPEVREKINTKLRSEENRKKNSEATKHRIATDPEYRAKILNALEVTRNSEKNRVRQSELLAAQRQDPEFQQRRKDALTARQEQDRLRGKRVQICDPVSKKCKRLFPDSEEYSTLVEAGWTDAKSAGIPGPRSKNKK